MLYSAWITQLRSQSGDNKRRIHVDWSADGVSAIFQMPADDFPVLDQVGTYFVRIAGTLKTETTDYTLDKATGTLVFLSTPTLGQAITVDAIAVHLLDADWLQITNNVISSLGDDFFKEFTNTTDYLSVANTISLDLNALLPECIAVYEFSFVPNASLEYKTVESLTNWRYDRENNIIYWGLRSAFPISGTPLRIRGLKRYILGDDVADSIDVQDRFLTILEYGCLSRYWRWRYKSVVELISKMTQENTRTPLQELIMLSDRFDNLFEKEKARLKPQKPARVIPGNKNGGGIA